MNPALRAFVPVFALIAALITGTAAAADAPAEKWRLNFQGQATSDGEVHLRLTPQTGEPIVVTIKIHSGRGQMFMAKDLLAAFKTQLPKGRFKSEIIHVQDVYLRAGNGEPAFTIEFVDSTVAGTKVHIGPV